MKLPIGIQDFHKLRTEGYAYVDKTEHIYRIINQAPYLFLSRPRRFGKSLTVATMAELFRRRKELFAGLWIYDHWDWEAPPHPVIWLEFAKLNYQGYGFSGAVNRALLRAGAEYGIDLDLELSPKENLDSLLRGLHERTGQRVVLLIDEYDKPLIDYLDDGDTLNRHQREIKAFYSVLKGNDGHIHQVFITGVSAFTKVSLFSDLNNLKNITLSPSAYHLTGITDSSSPGKLCTFALRFRKHQLPLPM